MLLQRRMYMCYVCYISQSYAVDISPLIVEVLLQEIIDMCDFSVGLSRQLNGSIIPSERKQILDITDHSIFSFFLSSSSFKLKLIFIG